MFTGIIRHTGEIREIINNGTNKTFWIESSMASDLHVDQSVSHNGVCLTVEALKGTVSQVTAIEETLQKTTLAQWKEGDIINLERGMLLNERLDGHIVQGHVDTAAKCINIDDKNGSTEYTFQIDHKYAPLIVEKGSITVDGISLTIFNVTGSSFTVAIIPYTHKHTNVQYLKEGNKVNIEFDMIGKYVSRLIQTR